MKTYLVGLHGISSRTSKSWMAWFALAVLTCSVGSASAEQDIDTLIAETVFESLPSWTDYIVIEPVSAPLWTEDFTPQRVAESVSASLPPDAMVDAAGNEVYSSDETMLRFKPVDGYVRYLARDRVFDIESSPHDLVDESVATAMTEELLTQLGISVEEVGAIEMAPMMLRIDDEDGSSTTYTRETMVDVTREIGGIPVERSLVRIAISNEGEIARLLLDWPDFHFAEGLSSIERERADVADEITAFAVERSGGAVVPEIHQELVYFPTGPRWASEYVPAIRVVVFDAEGGAPSMTFVPVVE